jgi:hypothetical protein
MKKIKYGQGYPKLQHGSVGEGGKGYCVIWASGDLYEAIDKLPVTVDLYVKSTLPFV